MSAKGPVRRARLIGLLVGCFLVLVLVVSRSSSSGATYTLNDLRKAVSEGVGSPSCDLSKSESRGFFCEDDKIWRMRHEVFKAQQPNQVKKTHDAGMGPPWWQDNYEPEFSCALEERLGRPGDGGKWVCDPYRIVELSEEKKCIVYSFGSNNDFSFEEAILKRLPKCEVHTFDHTITPTGVPDKVNFHSLGLAATDDAARKVSTLKTIMKDLKHDNDEHSVEILKVDIEGHEWDVFLPIIMRKELQHVRQFLIELHPRGFEETRKIFDLLRGLGWVIAHKEPNIIQHGTIVEYNFLNLGWTP